MTKGWKVFFESYPDYKNVFEHATTKDDTVILTGYSTCSYDPLDGPAIWTAKISCEKVSEWRVYTDNEENRRESDIVSF